MVHSSNLGNALPNSGGVSTYHLPFYRTIEFSPLQFLQRQGKLMKQYLRIAKRFNAVFAENAWDKPCFT